AGVPLPAFAAAPRGPFCKARAVMSALTPRADMCGATRDVRYGPEADICRSFKQYVCALQKRFWNCQANCLCRPEIDGKLEFRGLLYGYVLRLLALQYSLHKLGAMPKRGGTVRSERH